MKNSYRLLAIERTADSDPGCPAVIEKGEHEIIVVGSILTEEEESAMKKNAKVGVAPYERTVRIPRAVFEAAVDKLLTEKAEA